MTQENEESKRRNEEIIAYIQSSRELHVKEIVKSIGYDSKNVEYYLFFGQKYQAIDQQERQQINDHIRTVLRFISKRKRSWALIYFAQLQGNSEAAVQLINSSFEELPIE